MGGVFGVCFRVRGWEWKFGLSRFMRDYVDFYVFGMSLKHVVASGAEVAIWGLLIACEWATRVCCEACVCVRCAGILCSYGLADEFTFGYSYFI